MNKKQLAVLNEFGNVLMREVRDKTCKAMLGAVRGKVSDELSQALQAECEKLKLSPAGAKALDQLLIAAIDGTLLNFLLFLSLNDIGVIYKDKLGGTVDVSNQSEWCMEAAPWGKGGWIEQFSKFGSLYNDVYST